MSWLPENYPASGETVTFQEALQPEIVTLWRLRNEFLAQLNPYTATWGLPLWEDALGLKASEGLTLDTRRRQVVAKLQGRGTTTVPVVMDLAETLLGQPVSVTEWYSEYRVELEAEGLDGLPDGALPLRERLEEIMPAHLDWQIVIRTWAEYVISTATGPRTSQSEPPRLAGEMPGIFLDYGIAAGPRTTRSMPAGFSPAHPPTPLQISVRMGGAVSRIEALPVFSPS